MIGVRIGNGRRDSSLTVYGPTGSSEKDWKLVDRLEVCPTEILSINVERL